MKMTFVSIKYEKDGFSDTISISRHSEDANSVGRDYILDSFATLSSVFDRVLNKYFVSTDVECNHGGHRYNNISGNKSVFEKMFKEVFQK